MLERISISSSRRNEMVSITSKVAQVIKKSGVKEGLCIVYVPHTTAGVTINEDADPSVKTDILNKLSDVIPHSWRYQHMEGNSDAHIKASIIGSSVTIIIENGKPVLGTWQGIFFCEFDGPRTRTVYIKVIGNK